MYYMLEGVLEIYNGTYGYLPCFSLTKSKHISTDTGQGVGLNNVPGLNKNLWQSEASFHTCFHTLLYSVKQLGRPLPQWKWNEYSALTQYREQLYRGFDLFEWTASRKANLLSWCKRAYRETRSRSRRRRKMNWSLVGLIEDHLVTQYLTFFRANILSSRTYHWDGSCHPQTDLYTQETWKIRRES